MAHPFFFSSSQYPLYGVYHPPIGTVALQSNAVLLCTPIFHEYIRAHLIVKQLANLLANSGYAVLRFDYSGNGDSNGKSRESSIAQWIADIATATEELCDRAEVTTINIIGMRLGATLAAQAIDKGLSCDNLFVWDPIVRGTTYLDEISLLHAKLLGAPPIHGDFVECSGFEYSKELWNEISQLNLLDAALDKVKFVCVAAPETDIDADAFLHKHSTHPAHTKRIFTTTSIDTTNHKAIDKMILNLEAAKSVAQTFLESAS